MTRKSIIDPTLTRWSFPPPSETLQTCSATTVLSSKYVQQQDFVGYHQVKPTDTSLLKVCIVKISIDSIQ